MSDTDSLFEFMGTQIQSNAEYQEFIQGLAQYVEAVEEEYANSSVVKFETRATAHQICASQEMNTILYDIALSLRVLAGRNDK